MTDKDVKLKIAALVSDRGYVKSKITRIYDYCCVEKKKDAPVEALLEKRRRLVDALAEYESVNKAILVLMPEDDEDYSVYEDKYYAAIGILDKTIKAQKSDTNGDKSAPGEFKNLPKINIQTFNGSNVVDYYPFINLFKSVIGADKKLTHCEKLYYLRSYLSGEALDLIKNLPLTDDNYTAALALLENRYDNIPKILNYHINSLLDMPAFTKCTAQNLRSLISTVHLHIAALKNLKQPVEHWDSLLINILAKKVDAYTYRGFHLDRDSKEVPSLAQFIEFLEKRAVAMENSSEEKSPVIPSVSKPGKFNRAVSSVATSKPRVDCKYCQQGHRLFECPKFKMASDRDRCSFVKNKSLCTVCLNEHKGKCMLRLKCAVCQMRHNTLVHTPVVQEEASHAATEAQPSSEQNVVSMSGLSTGQDVLLPTAMVRLENKDGTFTYAKALLDSGSQVSFISEKLINKIKCHIMPSNQLISGVVENTNKISQKANIVVHSSVNNFKVDVSCCVVKNITCQLPQQSFNIKQFNIPEYVKLADINFNQTGEISLLLGCDIFFQVLQRESLPLTPSGPYLINTCFGYVVAAGCLPVTAGKSKVFSSNLCIKTQGNVCFTSSTPEQDAQLFELNKNISKFWECEKVPNIFKEGSSEHQLAEECFQNSVKLINKRFSVALPLKLELKDVQLGESFSYAVQRMYNLEKRLTKDPALGQQYKKFINDYLEQGHCSYIDISSYDLNAGNVYFLPHHPVLNPNSKTTPVRAVFDASMKTKSGLCLNDIMLNGEVVQSELFDILILLRTYKYILLCDIRNMYRQIFVDEEYCCLQNILWRDSNHDPMKCIQLKTVTYGLKSSAFLATRCLVELANIYEQQYPLAAFVLKHSSYVDDIQCGSNSASELLDIKNQLMLLMSEASLSLHKWYSNHAEVLADIPCDLQCLGNRQLDKNNTYLKTLGLSYDVSSDKLTMRCPETEIIQKYTKRQMLSFISKFFDPLGILGPILVQAKCLMQKVWFMELKWDDYLPDSLNKEWVEFATNLVQMSKVAVPRNINVPSAKAMELVGYADASNLAYGCCLYLRVVDEQDNVMVNLLCSKSRINPKNKQLTTPRLELNSFLLLAMLTKKVHDVLSLKYNIDKVIMYSDSQIVLSWLGIEPEKLSVYVANRVRQIKKLTSAFQYNYVHTSENPADCLSRGISPKSLETNVGQLWFHGPQSLQDINYVHCDAKGKKEVNIPEIKLESKACNSCNTTPNSLQCLLEKHSDIEKLTRIVSYVKRFIFNSKKENVNKQGKLCPEELSSALQTIIKLDQEKHFTCEIKALKSNNILKSSLNNLNPFLDSSGLLRVGGRLQNANLPFAQRHPIILPKGSNITKLIILKEHFRLKHAGQKLILSVLNETYWLINANREVKAVLHKCIICFKLKAKCASQLMGSLPLDRVNMSRPFQIVGTDYAGPFYVKQTRVRKPVITKAYVVIFVCFTTKAVHIELASDMTTDTFLGCLKRFISRRNKPTKIYCDNGTYFKGANNVLNDLYNLQSSTEHQEAVSNFCASERISFHFIPAYSPVFGGLWEAGVKSIKYHLKRVVSDTVLTYEELYTVLVQIEGILNSRPLTPLSRDQNDMSYLTPAHFLTGSSLSSYPELNLVDTNIGRLSFWKKCTQMQQCFWQQWHKQYLVMLQSRPKWKNAQPNVDKGAMVLLRNVNVSPLKWPVGRVINVLPGKDGKVRALEVKTPKGSIVKTSIMNVSPLPLSD